MLGSAREGWCLLVELERFSSVLGFALTSASQKLVLLKSNQKLHIFLAVSPNQKKNKMAKSTPL